MNNLPNFLLIVLGVVVFFFLVREVLTWYWKINKVVNLLQRIEENTRKGNVSLDDHAPSSLTEDDLQAIADGDEVYLRRNGIKASEV